TPGTKNGYPGLSYRSTAFGWVYFIVPADGLGEASGCTYARLPPSTSFTFAGSGAMPSVGIGTSAGIGVPASISPSGSARFQQLLSVGLHCTGRDTCCC